MKICFLPCGVTETAVEYIFHKNNLNYVKHLLFKGALCSFGEEIQSNIFNIYNVSEVKIQTQNYLPFL